MTHPRLTYFLSTSTSTFANERQRVQMGLVMLFSAFIGSRPGTPLADDDSSCRDSRESLAGDLSTNALAYDSDGDTLVDDIPNLKARNIRPGTICYGDIDLFLLRNPVISPVATVARFVMRRRRVDWYL